MSSSTEPQPENHPTSSSLPPSIYIMAGALVVLGIFMVFLYLYYTRHAPPLPPPLIQMQQLQHGRSAALSRRILDTLPSLTWSAGHDQSVECAICLSEYQESDELRVLPCQHVYHLTCVDTWFDSHSSCPTCRLNLTMTAEEEDVAS